MSKTTKRKIVTREVETEFTLPTEDQQIVKVVKGTIISKYNAVITRPDCIFMQINI